MRIVLLLIMLLAAVVLAVQNASAVTVDLFLWRIEASLAVVTASCFAVGVAAGVLLALPKLYRARSDRRRLRARLRELGIDDELDSAAVSPSLSDPRVPCKVRSSGLQRQPPQPGVDCHA
jgi:putative membrane protein